jgi:hypothetical protein
MRGKKKRAMMSGTAGDWKKNTIRSAKKDGKGTGKWQSGITKGVQRKKVR